MRRRPPARRLVLAMALALLALPASASSAPLEFPFRLPGGVPPQLRAEIRDRIGPAGPRGEFHPSLELETRNGYRVGVVGEGSAVALVVARRQRSAFTAYVARGVVTSGRIQASFGQLGRVAVRFRPAPNQPVRPDRRCRGRERPVERRGVFVGVIRFRGEHGYVAVDAHRAKGRISRPGPLCVRGHAVRRAARSVRPSQQSPWGSEPNLLIASWRHAVDSTAFAAIGNEHRSLFIALAAESEGRLAKLRFALADGASKAFAIDDALTLASVSPPTPFQGSGIYRAAPDGTRTWTGSLAVDFPGAGHAPLAGPAFEPALGAGWATWQRAGF